MKISEAMLIMQETLKGYGDLDLKIQVLDYEAGETIEKYVNEIELEHRITTSRESKNCNVLVISDGNK
ncbi:hypothetical protein C1H57_12580 [Clostridium sp. 2-1]|uniref:hypothetical protein n=1 Tax=Clostridium TaxID=1485 RepID=UPI000CDAED65|nr:MULTISPECIES: hypothetical protein [Clostridium]MBN7575999.1 hypothetical protein [Clostridium beijerinckii]MBN7581168.1 hypothetical protein [Clostridium beijerinckii]MBN7585720.1 hypothetical protein [Clostridium beijerinckii]MBO0521509.1 hypothetical protein [Clostridium beijerinckii]POO91016.1 hypothetical protein C1H57_12580 [Clostridium sp. 2-1]